MGCLAGQHCVPVLRSGKSSFESYVPSIGWLYADKAVWGGELWSKELCWVFLQKDNKINKAEILSYNVLYICRGLPPAIITHTTGSETETASISVPKVGTLKGGNGVDNNVGGTEDMTKIVASTVSFTSCQQRGRPQRRWQTQIRQR